MRAAWLGLAATVAIPAVSACGALGVVGVAALAAWPDDPTTDPGSSRFRVGGIIRGLSGNVTLQLNGTEVLTRSKDGPFFFESPIEDRGEFVVSLMEVPPEQECALVSAAGAVTEKSVNSVLVNCTTRTYSVGGSVTDLNGELGLRINGHEVLSTTSNGLFTFQTRLPRGQRYEVTVVTQPRGQQCSISEGAQGTITGHVETISVSCRPFLRLGDHQSALRVLGQEDFASKQPPTDGSSRLDTLRYPWGNPVFAGGKLYVSDRGAHRILVFDGLPTAHGQSARFVLGQLDGQSAGSHSGPEGFKNPESLSSDGSALAVADKGNHRVLLYRPLPGEGASPALVLGQAGFNSSTSGCGDSSLNQPRGVFIGHGKLIVADTHNHRVLVWNDIDSLQNGAPANLVLGQESRDACSSNRGLDEPSGSTLSLPSGVWTDGKRLLVADAGNHRVLLWTDFPTQNGQAASYVLGQRNLGSNVPGADKDMLNSPQAVSSTGEHVFVADYGNNRVLIWDQFPSDNGRSARVVLGQPDSPDEQKLDRPTGLLWATPYLFVTDYGNSRLLMYQSN